MKFRHRYAMLTVDTEALPKRASQDHVNRLIWGRHEKGTAGVGEMCAIGDEVGAKHVFFVDLCGAWRYPEAMREVVRWLDRAGQDVQLHAHPEVLPDTFWAEHGLAPRPSLMDEYADDGRAGFVISYFGKQIAEITGKDVLAFRAGSFRWNACTLRALKAVGIPLSFNNSMRAHRAGQCVFSEPTNSPYVWSNGVIEVPVTEKRTPRPGREDLWASLTFPESSYFPFEPRRPSLLSRLFARAGTVSVFLMHSWSLLYWDENGHATYEDDRRLEGYRHLLARLAKDYDVIATGDFLDLCRRGRIAPTHMVDVGKAERAT